MKRSHFAKPFSVSQLSSVIKVVLALIFVIVLAGCFTANDSKAETTRADSPDSSQGSGTGYQEQANVVSGSDAHASILLYHHVSDSTPRVTSVTEDELREHLQYLKDNDFTVIDIRDAIAAAKGEKEIPEKSVVITFDDAYQNIFTNGRPILNEFDVPWTLFVTTDPVGNTPGQYMSWDQIRTLHDEGVVIANHSTDHGHLPRRQDGESEREWEQRMRDNIRSAEQKIEQEVGVSYKLFAYPYGEYDNKLAEIVEDMGYIGFGQHSGGFGATSDFRAIPRFAAAGMYANLNSLGTKMAALSLPVLDVNYEDTLLAYDETHPVLEMTVDTSDFHRNNLQCFIRGEGYSPEWISDQTFRIQTSEPVNIGRSRYNCTVQSIEHSGRFYWWSIQWIRQDEQGNWPS